MSTVKAEIEIAAPIESVWETIMDPARLGDWVTIHKSVKNVSDSPLRQGATMDQSMHVRGLTFRVHWTLVVVDAPHAASGRAPAGPLEGAHPLRALAAPARGEPIPSTPMSSSPRADGLDMSRAGSSSARPPSARPTTHCRSFKTLLESQAANTVGRVCIVCATIRLSHTVEVAGGGVR